VHVGLTSPPESEGVSLSQDPRNLTVSPPPILTQGESQAYMNVLH